MEYQHNSNEDLNNLVQQQQERIAFLETQLREFDHKEQLFKESERRLELALEGSQMGLWDQDFKKGLLYRNERWASMLGYSLDEINADLFSWKKLIHPEDQKFVEEQLALHESGKSRFMQIEHRLRCKDGSYKWILNWGRISERDDQGNPLRAAGIHMDIHDRKTFEEKLARSEYEYRELFRNAHDAILIIDPTDEIILEANDRALTLYGFPRNEFIGISLRSLSKYPEKGDKRVAETLEKGFIRHFETTQYHRDGSEIRLEISASIIEYQGEKAILSLNHDITKRKQLETSLIRAKEKAEESERLKSAFFANMSHEIRTPMNGILGFASLLRSPDITGEDQQKFIDIIEKSGQRMLQIINDLINFSKVEAGQMPVHVAEVNINDLFASLYTFFQLEASGKSIRLSQRISLPDEQAVMLTDEEKLQAILTNLIKNALKFTLKGWVEFGYHVDDSGVEFYVSDSGIGIPETQITTVFDRFSQVEDIPTSTQQGSGLGLSITKAYVELLGGNIHVTSEVDKGSRFTFRLPGTLVVKHDESAEDVKTTEPSLITPNGLHVLIVEDDDASDVLITLNIKPWCASIYHTKSGLDAVAICRDHPGLNLILMDIRLPGISGYEATRKIRQFNEDVVIVAQTAYALPEDREKALKAGCNDYLAKPLNRESLVHICQNIKS